MEKKSGKRGRRRWRKWKPGSYKPTTGRKERLHLISTTKKIGDFFLFHHTKKIHWWEDLPILFHSEAVCKQLQKIIKIPFFQQIKNAIRTHIAKLSKLHSAKDYVYLLNESSPLFSTALVVKEHFYWILQVLILIPLSLFRVETKVQKIK